MIWSSVLPRPSAWSPLLPHPPPWPRRIFGCHDLGDATGRQQLEARGAAEHPAGHTQDSLRHTLSPALGLVVLRKKPGLDEFVSSRLRNAWPPAGC